VYDIKWLYPLRGTYRKSEGHVVPHTPPVAPPMPAANSWF